ncbi:hypothetical protein M0811_14122 [Anaeramoeba ignava]|uniref:Transmembrane protein n=1 Tax=Anaeramoeba ignava TaxID=1746090 RepID=A0A9Q0LZF6_ANAIG|nr:hypothetical protein M0811_14122 [Anaeramoeba ignava]
MFYSLINEKNVSFVIIFNQLVIKFLQKFNQSNNTIPLNSYFPFPSYRSLISLLFADPNIVSLKFIIQEIQNNLNLKQSKRKLLFILLLFYHWIIFAIQKITFSKKQKQENIILLEFLDQFLNLAQSLNNNNNKNIIIHISDLFLKDKFKLNLKFIQNLENPNLSFGLIYFLLISYNQFKHKNQIEKIFPKLKENLIRNQWNLHLFYFSFYSVN